MKRTGRKQKACPIPESALVSWCEMCGEIIRSMIAQSEGMDSGRGPTFQTVSQDSESHPSG